MLKKYLFGVTALFTSRVLAETEEDKKNYEAWAEVMDHYKYSWEPSEVTTEDGYKLVTFQITGKADEDPKVPTKPPIIINHGLFDDATSWLGVFRLTCPDCHPYILQLVDQGYDVWMSNNRGT